MLFSLPGGSTGDFDEPTEPMDDCLPSSLTQVKPSRSTFSSVAKYSRPRLWSLARIALFTLLLDFLLPFVPAANRVVLSPSSSPCGKKNTKLNAISVEHFRLFFRFFQYTKTNFKKIRTETRFYSLSVVLLVVLE